jgi:hypothetical protein
MALEVGKSTLVSGQLLGPCLIFEGYYRKYYHIRSLWTKNSTLKRKIIKKAEPYIKASLFIEMIFLNTVVLLSQT